MTGRALAEQSAAAATITLAATSGAPTIEARIAGFREALLDHGCELIGEAALMAMLSRIEQPGMPACDILIDCRLVIRESCGAKAR